MVRRNTAGGPQDKYSKVPQLTTEAEARLVYQCSREPGLIEPPTVLQELCSYREGHPGALSREQVNWSRRGWRTLAASSNHGKALLSNGPRRPHPLAAPIRLGPVPILHRESAVRGRADVIVISSFPDSRITTSEQLRFSRVYLLSSLV